MNRCGGREKSEPTCKDIPISTVQRYYDTFLFDIEESCLFLFIGLLPQTRF